MCTKQGDTATSRAIIPKEVVGKLQEFNKALGELEQTMSKHFAVNFEQHLKERNAVEMARIDVMSIFSLTSLGWIAAAIKGEESSENTKLRTELARSEDYHQRLKELESRKTAPRVNPVAAKNFVRNALWELPTTEANEEISNSDVESKRRKTDDSYISE